MSNNDENLYCIKCKKLFKNKGTFSTHLISKVHLKNNTNILKKSTKIHTKSTVSKTACDTEIDYAENSTINDDISYTTYKIDNFEAKLSKVLKRESEKKNTRIKRMTQKSDALNSVLYELENNYDNIEDNKNIIQNRNEITKMNRAGDNLQKNKLTSSRSSFIKSTLKP